jgi:RNA polymerase sigma-70 factor (ECF subfamily)
LQDQIPTTHGESLTEELVRRVLQGEEEAINKFFRICRRRCWSYFRMKGIPAANAEDLAQDCTVHIWLNLSRYSPGNFNGWAWQIARRKLIDWVKKHPDIMKGELLPPSLADCGASNESDEETKAPGKAEPIPAALVSSVGEAALEQEGQVQIDKAQAVREALEKLSHDDREIIHLRYFENLTNAEIAERLAIEVNTAKVRLSRARGRLVKLLKDDPRIRLRK